MREARKGALGVLLVLCLCLCAGVPEASAQSDNTYISYNDFYQDLAPYGQWIQDPKYGYVWSPNDNTGDFRPYYTGGHWAMTQFGNTWVSDYPWGWACFHYGRWIYDTYYGWLWIPGTDWGPAWVSWRSGDGYYGWAPLSPDYMDFTTDYSCPNSWWVFLPPQYLYSGNYYRYWYGPHGNSHIIKDTHFLNHTYSTNHITYVTGPTGAETEQITHQPVQLLHLSNSNNMNSHVHNSELKMYHPAQVTPGTSMGGAKITPPNVVSATQPIRQASQPADAAPAQYRSDLPKNAGHTETIGTNFNETAQPEPSHARNANPYEYDVNRPVEQPGQARESAPRQEESPAAMPQAQEQMHVAEAPRAQPSMPAHSAQAASAPGHASAAPASGRR